MINIQMNPSESTRKIDENINVGRWRKYVNDNLFDFDRDKVINLIEKISESKVDVFGNNQQEDIVNMLIQLEKQIDDRFSGNLKEEFKSEIQAAISFISNF